MAFENKHASCAHADQAEAKAELQLREMEQREGQEAIFYVTASFY